MKISIIKFLNWKFFQNFCKFICVCSFVTINHHCSWKIRELLFEKYAYYVYAYEASLIIGRQKRLTTTRNTPAPLGMQILWCTIYNCRKLQGNNTIHCHRRVFVPSFVCFWLGFWFLRPCLRRTDIRVTRSVTSLFGFRRDFRSNRNSFSCFYSEGTACICEYALNFVRFLANFKITWNVVRSKGLIKFTEFIIVTHCHAEIWCNGLKTGFDSNGTIWYFLRTESKKHYLHAIVYLIVGFQQP